MLVGSSRAASGAFHSDILFYDLAGMSAAQFVDEGVVTGGKLYLYFFLRFS